jgi:hypothetical protein
MDGLNDQEEVSIIFSNPFLADTDGDGMSDADEVTAQTDPLDMLSLPPTPTPEPAATPSPTALPTQAPPSTPATSAGTPSGTPAATPVGTATRVPAVLPTLSPEASPISHRAPAAGTPLAPSALTALDNDGLATLNEVAIYGTDPLTSDTDGDDVNDGEEVASGSNPLDPAH